jgi:hypothetical protein
MSDHDDELLQRRLSTLLRGVVDTITALDGRGISFGDSIDWQVFVVQSESRSLLHKLPEV